MWDKTHRMAPGILNTTVHHLWLYVRYWWMKVNFSSATITFDRLYIAVFCKKETVKRLKFVLFLRHTSRHVHKPSTMCLVCRLRQSYHFKTENTLQVSPKDHVHCGNSFIQYNINLWRRMIVFGSSWQSEVDRSKFTFMVVCFSNQSGQQCLFSRCSINARVWRRHNDISMRYIS